MSRRQQRAFTRRMRRYNTKLQSNTKCAIISRLKRYIDGLPLQDDRRNEFSHIGSTKREWHKKLRSFSKKELRKKIRELQIAS